MSVDEEVPPTLTAELVARLAALHGEPPGAAEVALSALKYGSLASLIAHGVIAPIDLESDRAERISVTPRGRAIMAACAARRMAYRKPLSPELRGRLRLLAGEPAGVAAVALSGLPYDALETLALHGIIEPLDLEADSAAAIRLTEHGSRVIRSYEERPSREPVVQELDMAWLGLLADRQSGTMQLGAVACFAGPAPEFSKILEHAAARLHRVPRCRQRLSKPPFLRWADDPNFNLEHHVRNVSLAQGGREGAFEDLLATIFSDRLDRERPLWQVWVVEGFEGGGFAMVSKVHFTLLEGLSGLNLVEMLYDLSEDRVEGIEDVPWVPDEPSFLGRVSSSAQGVVSFVAKPGRPREVIEVINGLGQMAWGSFGSSSRSPVNVDVGPHRRVVFADVRNQDLARLKTGLGAGHEDAILTGLACGLRRWLSDRGGSVHGLELRALVVTMPGRRDEGPLVNRMDTRVAALPLDAADPIDCLDAVRQGRSPGEEARPRSAVTQMTRLVAGTRNTNLVVTFLPPYPFPLYASGRRMESLHMVPFLPGDHALAVAVMPYDDGVFCSLMADRDAIPDLDALQASFKDGLDQLVGSAGHEKVGAGRA